MTKVVSTNIYFDVTAHLKKIDDIFQDFMADKLEDMVWLRLFGEKTKATRNSTYLLGTWVTGVTLVNENADYPQAEWDPDTTITMTKHKYWANVIVTEEVKLYDEYDVIKDRIESIVDDWMDKLDACLADVFIKWFSTSAYTDKMGLTVTPIGQEARALFNSTDGTIITYNSNNSPILTNVSLSVAREQAAKHKDSNGQLRPIKLDTLLVWPALQDKAYRILNSEKLSNNNDVNPNKWKFNLIVWDRLAQGNSGNSTDAYWFVMNASKAKKQLKFEWARMPRLKAPDKIVFDQNDVHNFSMIYSYGFLNLPYIMWSQGSYTSVTDDPLTVNNIWQ